MRNFVIDMDHLVLLW